MTDSNFERLSAAYDGEATPSERAEVDRWLAESSAASEVWDDFGQISQRLRELPAGSLSADFTDSVLSRISSPSPSSVQSVGSARRWLLPISAFASAAALLVVIRFAIVDPQDAKVAERKKFERTVASAKLPRDADAVSAPMSSPPPAGDAAKVSARRSGSAPAGAANGATAPELRVASAPAALPTPPSETALPGAAEPPLSRQDAPGMVPGAVLEERIEQGGVVKVVRIFVIDQGQLEKFQEVLSRNEILPEPQPDQPQPQPASRQPIEQPVLLVVATEKQLSTALRESVERNVVEKYVDGVPLEIAQLPQDWQVALGAEASPSRSTMPAAPAGTSPSRAVAKDAEKKTVKLAGADKNAETRRSKQTSVALTAPMKPLFEDPTAKPAAGTSPPVRRAQEPATVSPANDQELAKSKTPDAVPATASVPPADRWVILVQVAPSKSLKARDTTPRKAGDG